MSQHEPKGTPKASMEVIDLVVDVPPVALSQDLECSEICVPSDKKKRKTPSSAGSRIRAKFWIGTLNNFTAAETRALHALSMNSTVAFAVWQHERGKEGVDHHQLFIALVDPVSLATLKTILCSGRWHLERAADPKAAMAYCQKAGSRLEGPWEIGTAPQFVQVTHCYQAWGHPEIFRTVVGQFY